MSMQKSHLLVLMAGAVLGAGLLMVTSRSAQAEGSKPLPPTGSSAWAVVNPGQIAVGSDDSSVYLYQSGTLTIVSKSVSVDGKPLVTKVGGL